MLLVVHLGVAQPEPRPEGAVGLGVGGRCALVDLAIDEQGGGAVGPFDEQFAIGWASVAPVEVEAPLPNDLERVLKQLRKVRPHRTRRSSS